MVRKFFNSLKKSMEAPQDSDEQENYVELSPSNAQSFDQKVIVRPYVLEDFSDVKPIIEAIRVGYTVALINIAPLKEKDLVELKRAINKLKKTVDAVEGDIAGFGDDYIVVAPNFAEIYRSPDTKDAEKDL